jgi:aryl-alcohol dehydrogenase-like predicted oxidoreductase
VQPRYNLLYREIETELLPLARSAKLGVLVYNPIAGGMLSGKYRYGQSPQDGTRFTLGGAGAVYQNRYWDQVQLEAVTALAERARGLGHSLASVAVAWVLSQPGITSAVVGASRPEQLEATLAGAELELDEDLKRACDQVWWQLPRRPVADGYR